MDTTALSGAVATLVAALAAFVETIRRGAWVPRFVYDREVTRGDLADARADKLEVALNAMQRAFEDQSRLVAQLVDERRGTSDGPGPAA